jgi:hypothetical protein
MQPSVRLAVACLLACALPSGAGAQVVRGRIVDALDGEPVTGAWVLLLDSAEQAHSRSLTDALGRFVVRGDTAGSFRLRALVVGYEKWESELIALEIGQSVEQDITMTMLRVALPAFTVEAEQTCRVRPGAGEPAAALWEEVKKALGATQWTIDQRLYRFRSAFTERTLTNFLAVVSDTTRRRLGFSAWPFESISADSLMQYGFVQPAPGGPIYYGPDGQVLVSELFLDAHCFHIQRAAEDSSAVVGLAFEPVRDRELPDIRGVLWVDTATTALRQLQFSYTNLGRWAPAELVGGTVEFAVLPSGAWFIRRWEMRAPIGRISRREADRQRPGRMSADTVLAGFREREATVLAVLNTRGEVVVDFGPK